MKEDFAHLSIFLTDIDLHDKSGNLDYQHVILGQKSEGGRRREGGWFEWWEAPAPLSIRLAPHSAPPSERGRKEEVEKGEEGREGLRDFRLHLPLPQSLPAFLSGRGHQPRNLSIQQQVWDSDRLFL